MRLNLTDCLAATLLACIVICYFRHENSVAASQEMFAVTAMYLTYTVARLLEAKFPIAYGRLLLASIFIWLFYESGLGFLQLAGIKLSGNQNFRMTGSFPNPGPYGGFIATCIALLIGWLVTEKPDKTVQTLTSILLVVAVPALLLSGSRAGMLAATISALAAALKHERLRQTVQKNMLTICLIGLLAGSVLYLAKKPSADSRLFMAKITLSGMLQKGLEGSGLGTYSATYAEFQEEYFQKNGGETFDIAQMDKAGRLYAECPDLPFNELLRAGVETGPLNMLVLAGLMAVSLINAFRKNSFTAYGLTALTVFSMFSYPMDIMQFRILLPVLLAANAGYLDGIYNAGYLEEINNTANQLKNRNAVRVKFTAAAFAVIGIGLTVIHITQLPQQRIHRRALEAWNTSNYQRQIANPELTISIGRSLSPNLDSNPDYLFSYGKALAETGQYSASDSVLLMGTKVSGDPMFWNLLGKNSQLGGDFARAEQCYKKAFLRSPGRIYPIHLLTRLYQESGETIKSKEMNQLLQTFTPKIESSLTDSLRHIATF